MKKRVLFTTLALCMGWYVGSLTAEQTDHHETSAPQEASTHGGEHGGTAPAAEALAHGAVAGAPWLCCVLLGTAGLFASAVVIGIPTLKLKGEEPAEDEGHDDPH